MVFPEIAVAQDVTSSTMFTQDANTLDTSLVKLITDAKDKGGNSGLADAVDPSIQQFIFDIFFEQNLFTGWGFQLTNTYSSSIKKGAKSFLVYNGDKSDKI